MQTTISHTTEVKPNDFIWIHMTNHYPNSGVIRTTYEATNGRLPRLTVHGTLSHAVASHTYGDWDDKRYLIAIPLGDLIDENRMPENLNSVDTFFYGSVKLPETTILLAGNHGSPLVEEGEMKEYPNSLQHMQTPTRFRKTICKGPAHGMDRKIVESFGATYRSGGMWGYGFIGDERVLDRLRETTGLIGGSHGGNLFGMFEDAMRQMRSDLPRNRVNGAEFMESILDRLPKEEMKKMAEEELKLYYRSLGSADEKVVKGKR